MINKRGPLPRGVICHPRPYSWSGRHGVLSLVRGGGGFNPRDLDPGGVKSVTYSVMRDVVSNLLIGSTRHYRKVAFARKVVGLLARKSWNINRNF